MFKQAIWLSAALVAIAPRWTHCTTQTYAIEPTDTVVSFEVSKLGVAKRRGVFDGVAGTVLLDVQAGDGSIDIVVNARSVQTGDAATQVFVRGKSFLNVERYSEISYKAEHIVFVNDKPSRIEGKLTLRGVTKSVPLSVSEFACQDESVSSRPPPSPRCVVDASATFRRSDFGMTQYVPLVSDHVTLGIHSVTTRLPSP